MELKSYGNPSVVESLIFFSLEVSAAHVGKKQCVWNPTAIPQVRIYTAIYIQLSVLIHHAEDVYDKYTYLNNLRRRYMYIIHTLKRTMTMKSVNKWHGLNIGKTYTNKGNGAKKVNVLHHTCSNVILTIPSLPIILCWDWPRINFCNSQSYAGNC